MLYELVRYEGVRPVKNPSTKGPFLEAVRETVLETSEDWVALEAKCAELDKNSISLAVVRHGFRPV